MSPIPVLASAALAMAGAFFGVVMSRVLWAEDLKHTQHLRQIWDRQEASMREQIETMQRTLKLKDNTIRLLQEKGETK